MSSASRFPDVTLGGPRPLKLAPSAVDVAGGKLLFEDGSCELNNPFPCGQRKFTVNYDGLDPTEAAILDAHFDEAQGGTREFLFFDYTTGRLYDRVRYESYRKPRHIKWWSQKRQITLVRFP